MRSLRAGPGRRRSTGSWDPEDEEPEFSELERSTSTFTPGYGSTRVASGCSQCDLGLPSRLRQSRLRALRRGGRVRLLGAVGRLRRFHPAPTGHPASPVVPEQFGDALTGGAVDAVRRGRSCTCGRLGGVPAAGTVGAGADVPLFGSASDGVSARLLPGRRRSDGCAIGGSDGRTDGSRRPEGADQPGQRSQTSGGAASVGAGAGASPDSDAGPVVHAVRGRDLQTGLDGDHRGDSDGGGGAVGRAQDARRWNRLQRGGTSPSDDSRMWAMTPWYLVRSAISVGFAFLLASGTAFLFLMAIFSSDLGQEKSETFGSIPLPVRFYTIFLLGVALDLLILWLAPWGAATRRGGAHILNSVAPSDNARRNLVMAMLGIGAVILILSFAGLMPIPRMSPYGT